MQKATLALFTLMLVVRSLPAAGGKEAPSQPLSPQFSEAETYAGLLIEPITRVAQEYIQIDAKGSFRTVSVPELAFAALQGLYETARVPVPPTLEADIQKTAKLDVAAQTQAVQALIVQARLNLGSSEALKGENALLASFQAMSKVLDPYSIVISGEELNRGFGNDSEQGIGLDVTEKVGAGPLVVKAVTPGGPAQKAGIRPGDQITHVNGKSADGIDAYQGRVLFGANFEFAQVSQSGLSKIELTLLRPGAKERRKIILSPESFQPETVFGVCRNSDETWNYWVDRDKKIAQVRIGRLTTGTAAALQDLLTALQGDGLRGLILDLRWCPGGFLNEAAATARLFLGKCTIATIKTGLDEQKIPSDLDPNKFLDFPILILVNGETSGGAELIAAALQDNKRAMVGGQRSLGKGSVQNLLPLPLNSAGMKITKGAFIRPNGKNLHRFPDSKPTDDWGVQPDPKLEWRITPGLSRQLADWWLLQTLRPASSNEALPLDDPEADPQRQAALQVLQGMVK